MKLFRNWLLHSEVFETMWLKKRHIKCSLSELNVSPKLDIKFWF